MVFIVLNQRVNIFGIKTVHVGCVQGPDSQHGFNVSERQVFKIFEYSFVLFCSGSSWYINMLSISEYTFNGVFLIGVDIY